MSTMDYLEFKEHIEHAFTQKDKAEYYKRQDLGAINKKANAVITELNEYMQTCKKIADKKQGWADNANKIINSPAGSYAKSETQNPAKRFSGQKFDSPRENASNYAKDAKYWKRQYELALAIKKEILADPTKASKGTRIGQLGIPESAVSHSNLEHASIAGVPARLRSKMQDAIYKKTGYQSKGSYAGAPSNAKQATADQNKAVANARFSAGIKSAIEACNRDAEEAQRVYVEATTRINNIVSRSRGEVNSIIRSVNEYNENVRNIRSQTITKKSTFSAVANGKLYQGVRDEQVPVDANRQFISFSAGAQKISANKYVYKPKMLLIDSDPGTYKEV